jgi:hypothetical protein
VQISATDPTGKGLTYSADGLPNGLSIDQTGLITGTVAAGAANGSPYSVDVTVSNSQGSTDVSFLWYVVAPSLAPVVQPPAWQSNAEGDQVSLQIGATDPTGQGLTYSADCLPGGLSIDQNGLISGTVAAGAADGSPYWVEVTVSNHAGSTEVCLLWTVTTPGPVVAQVPDQFNFEGDQAYAPVYATDPSGQGLTYSAKGLPAGLSIDQTGLITGTVATGDANGSPYSVDVTVSNSQGSTNVSFSWYVAALSLTPVVSQPAYQSNTEGDSVALPIIASDPAGSGLTFAAQGLPAGLSIDPQLGVITGTVADGAANGNPYWVDVTVSNSAGSTDVSFSWTITPKAQAPVVVNPGDQFSATNFQVSLKINASDPNGEGLTYGATGLPPGLSIDSGSGVISGTISQGANTSNPYSVTVKVSNGSFETDVTFNWFVSHVTTKFHSLGLLTLGV